MAGGSQRSEVPRQPSRREVLALFAKEMIGGMEVESSQGLAPENLLGSGEEWVLSLAVAMSASANSATERSVRALTRREWANSVVYSCVDSSDRRSVVKIGRSWQSSTAESLHRDAVYLLDAFAEQGAGSLVAQPIAWSADPPAICSEFVPGVDGAPLMSGLLGGKSNTDLNVARDLVWSWGRALAEYHRAERARVDPQESQMAERHIARVNRVLRVPESTLGKLEGWRSISRSFDDVGLHNIRLTTEGRICLVDLPEERTIRPIHVDLAAALAWLDDAYRDAPLRMRSRLRARLGESLLEGYAEVGLLDVRTGENRWWIRFHQVWSQLNWVKTAARRRHFTQTVVNLYRAGVGLLSLRRYPGR